MNIKIKKQEVIYLYSAKRRCEELEWALDLDRSYVDYLTDRLLRLNTPGMKKKGQKAVRLTVKSCVDTRPPLVFQRLVPQPGSPLVVDDTEYQVLEHALRRLQLTATQLKKAKRAARRIEN